MTFQSEYMKIDHVQMFKKLTVHSRSILLPVLVGVSRALLDASIKGITFLTCDLMPNPVMQQTKDVRFTAVVTSAKSQAA